VDDEVESEAGGEDEGDKTGGIFANVSAPSDDERNAGDGGDESEITGDLRLRELVCGEQYEEQVEGGAETEEEPDVSHV
jgi:hypothetical protein